MMVEHGISGGGGSDKFTVQSPSAVNKYQETTSSTYNTYPPPLATYEDVVASRELFMDTLKKHHASMGTKFMIPIVGGRDLDLHRLFVEVTSRGGIAKVVKDRKWKEVTAVFSFPSSATNASFILRKYYVSLLYHYEQIYFFKVKCWNPSPGDAIQSLTTITTPSRGLPEYSPSVAQRTHITSPQPRENSATSMPEVSLAPSAGSPVHGVIDGKFDSGYLVTVKIGVEEFKGVLYQIPSNNDQQMFTNQTESAAAKFMNNHLSVKPGVTRRKRRKKSEIRKRDPAHPKPNRSGYNFFFAEQHARLKPHYHGKDREISRIIGELWNKLQEPERAVYQEKALKDKERYKLEMEDYRERLRTGQLVRTVTPVQQNQPMPQVNFTTDLNTNIQLEPENEASSEKSDKSNLEEYESADNKDSDFEDYSQAAADTELKNVNIEIMANEAFDLQTRRDEQQDGTREENKMFSFQNDSMVLGEDGISVPIQEREQPATTSNNADESVPNL